MTADRGERRDDGAQPRRRRRDYLGPEHRRERERRYREANRERINARNRQRYAANPERERESWRRYRDRNRDKLNKRSRDRYRDNPEVRERQRQLRQASQEYNREYQRRWREANRDKLRRQSRARYAADLAGMRAKTMRERHGLWPEDWHELWMLGCWICGDPLPDIDSAPWHAIHVDHDHRRRCCPPGYSCAQCRRGLAHSECNTAIGLLGEDPARFRRIADRLEEDQRRRRPVPEPLTLFDYPEGPP